jgi:hypothetical protein
VGWAPARHNRNVPLRFFPASYDNVLGCSPQARGPHQVPPRPQGLLEEIPCACFILRKYTLIPTTWSPAGDAVVVSPDISSGLPIQAVHRWPPPGSRPERYTTPATKGMLYCSHE